jgi:Rieske Fe-S protein
LQSLSGDRSPETSGDGAGSGSIKLPGDSRSPDAPTEMLPTEAAFLSPAEGDPDAMEGVDPFTLWAATSGKPLTSPQTPKTSTRRTPVRRAKSDPRSPNEPAPAQFGRRKLLTLLAAGTAGVITVVTIGGISLARSPESTKPSPLEIDDGHGSKTGSTSTTSVKERGRERVGDRERDGEGDGEGKWPHKKPTPSGSPGAKPTSSPTQTQTPQPSPTSRPTQTPTPTMPTGTVIGSTSLATNSAVSFINPADRQASWLVHMSNGNFVAVEQACTHAGVAVRYNASTGQFNCPAHGAIFNADGTNPQAPATRPLPPVHITVNANGTITTP